MIGTCRWCFKDKSSYTQTFCTYVFVYLVIVSARSVAHCISWCLTVNLLVLCIPQVRTLCESCICRIASRDVFQIMNIVNVSYLAIDAENSATWTAGAVTWLTRCLRECLAYVCCARVDHAAYLQEKSSKSKHSHLAHLKHLPYLMLVGSRRAPENHRRDMCC